MSYLVDIIDTTSNYIKLIKRIGMIKYLIFNITIKIFRKFYI